jgi:hypothetical protein
MLGGNGNNFLSIIAVGISGLCLAGLITYTFAFRKLKTELEEMRGQTKKNLKRAEELYEVCRKYSSLRDKLEELARRHKEVQGRPASKGP